MIYLECKPDYALVRALTGISKREIIHEFKGKFEVCKRVNNSTNCKGMIDEDPGSVQPRYVNTLKPANDLSSYDIRVLRDNDKSNYLIVLCPRLEEWILGAAQEAGLNVREFGLSNRGGQLHQEINASLAKFEKLLAELKNSNRLRTLRGLLERR